MVAHRTYSAAARASMSAARKGKAHPHKGVHGSHPGAKGKAHPHKGHKGPHPGAAGKKHPHAGSHAPRPGARHPRSH